MQVFSSFNEYTGQVRFVKTGYGYSIQIAIVTFRFGAESFNFHFFDRDSLQKGINSETKKLVLQKKFSEDSFLYDYILSGLKVLFKIEFR